MKTHRFAILSVLAFSALTLFSCAPESESTGDVQKTDCPEEITARAIRFAELYRGSETQYAWGGQDAVRAIKIDCSGLVVMCYKYALVDTGYSLPFSDASASGMYADFSRSVPIGELRQGDLIFMGESDSSRITHIAIFDRIENGAVYFIDSTQKDTDGDGVDDINGVTERNYEVSDKRLKSFGIMQVAK